MLKTVTGRHFNPEKTLITACEVNRESAKNSKFSTKKIFQKKSGYILEMTFQGRGKIYGRGT